MNKIKSIISDEFNITLTVTNSCNYRCKYCPPNLQNGSEEPILVETYIKFFTNLIEDNPQINNYSERFISITGGEPSLYKGIEAAVIGRRLHDIGYEIQTYCESEGFSVVRELVGHGIGRNLHEAPEVPNFGKRGSGPKIQEGLVIAIEPMINIGKKNITHGKDGWTIKTSDGKASAHFEHTIAVLKDKTEILSSFEMIETVLKERNLIIV
jgi:methionyl aminopeptidase